MSQSKELVVLSQRTKDLEKIIEKGRKTFVDVGFALLEMNSDKRYREYCPLYGDDLTFGKYCKLRWGFGLSYAKDLMASAKAVAEIEMAGIPAIPDNAGQAVELSRVAEGERVEVWAEVVEQHEPAEITAAVIREHVEARKPNGATGTSTDAEVVVDFGSYLNNISQAVRAARRAGATTQEIYNAYQAGLST